MSDERVVLCADSVVAEVPPFRRLRAGNETVKRRSRLGNACLTALAELSRSTARPAAMLNAHSLGSKRIADHPERRARRITLAREHAGQPSGSCRRIEAAGRPASLAATRARAVGLLLLGRERRRPRRPRPRARPPGAASSNASARLASPRPVCRDSTHACGEHGVVDQPDLAEPVEHRCTDLVGHAAAPHRFVELRPGLRRGRRAGEARWSERRFPDPARRRPASPCLGLPSSGRQPGLEVDRRLRPAHRPADRCRASP